MLKKITVPEGIEPVSDSQLKTLTKCVQGCENVFAADDESIEV